MAGFECLPMKTKRKDIDRVNDDFSDFSLSSPARKIRRLDVDLPPIMEEEEAEMAAAKPLVEDLEPQPVNQERAIILFNPIQAQQRFAEHIFVDTDLISGFKNQLLRPGYSSNARIADDGYDENHPSNKSRAVILWNPWKSLTAKSMEVLQQQHRPEIIQLDEMGEDETMGEASMEIEEGGFNTYLSQNHLQPLANVFGETEGLHQWQQQSHCMMPQPPQTNSTPVSWFR